MRTAMASGIIICLIGCSTDTKVVDKHQGRAAQVEKPPQFLGEKPDKLVEYDLTGMWEAVRFLKKDGTSDLPRWEQKFTLQRQPKQRLTWSTDDHGTFSLTDKLPQFLRRQDVNGKVKWFSINDQSFGVLTMTGDDGHPYMMIRREGGEKLPPIDYR